MANVLINAPKTAAKGQTVEIKALIMHPMETGFRAGTNGRIIPRNIIEHFTATWNGAEIFRMDFSPAIAANPFVSFFTVATRERHDRLPLDRRRGLRRRAPGRHHGDMTRLTIGLGLASVFAASLALAQAGEPRHSGYQDMGPALQKMQDDDTANPGHAVRPGGRGAVAAEGRHRRQVLRRLPPGRGHQHEGRGGALSRDPAGADKPVDLEGRINLCRTDRSSRRRRSPPESPRAAGPHRLRRPAVARPADRAARRSAPGAVP